MTNIPESPFLTTKEAASFLRLKPQTLAKMRTYGAGPKYRKHGRRVLYVEEELRAWSMANDREPLPHVG